MILVLCRSELFFETLKSFAAGESLTRFPGDDLQAFAAEIADKKPEIVVYDPSYFVDPAPFRLVSPSTRFVVTADPGDEGRVGEALRYGAVASLGKPLVAGEATTVFALAR